MSISTHNTAAVDTAAVDAVDAVNILVGELALGLNDDDPRRRALRSIQRGLDELHRAYCTDPAGLTFPASWLEPADQSVASWLHDGWDDPGAGGAVKCSQPRPRCGGGAACIIDRRALAAAFDRIGHQGSPVFRQRVADAYDEVAQ